MKVFITGTDTDIGKTLISSWICLHTGYNYFKPIQTGNIFDIDTLTVTQLTNSKVLPETYSYSQPLSPHLAAKLDNDRIDIKRIRIPDEDVIIEGAGGLLVPLNEEYMMIDLIRSLQVPVILVSRFKLGTINHTLLSLEALRARNITVLGVIMNGEYNAGNKEAIEYFGKTKVIACFPRLENVSKEDLLKIPFTEELISIFKL